MKKVPAIILLTLVNLAAVFAVSALLLLLTFTTKLPGIAMIIGLLVLVELGIASGFIFRKFKKKYDLKLSEFILAAYVPSAAAANIGFIVISVLGILHFSGLREIFCSLFIMIAAVIYLCFGIFSSVNPTKEKDDTKG